jgi:threonine/homoserine/homoserine lactone efflux protein
MQFLWNGILMGLALSILVGPLLITIIQTSLEQGARAGLTVCSGIWASDLFFIAATYFGLNYVMAITRWDGFELTVGLLGGLVLMAFGAAIFFARTPIETMNLSETIRFDSYPNLWMKGFLVNTLNPFTVFFWAGVAGGLLAERQGGALNTWLFYFGIMLVIFTTDSLKVVLAKKVRRLLRPVYVLRVRQVSGFTLFAFGVVLILRVVLWGGS